MTTMPNMKLPDILGQFRKKDPAAGSGTGKSYEPIAPVGGKTPRARCEPKEEAVAPGHSWWESLLSPCSLPWGNL